MIKTSETVVFFGNERLATGVTTSAPTLRALIKADYNVACVITNYPAVQSRNRRELEIIEVAEQHNIAVLLPNKLTEVKSRLKELGADVGVLAAYGNIVPQDVIDLFPSGIINIHPSVLPLHRGPTPIESAILSGETKTGVSLMQLTKQLDAGPIIAQEHVTLKGTESKQELADLLLGLGAEMLIKHLPAVLKDESTLQPQRDADATYDQLIEKDDANLDWYKPAIQLAREVRAYLDWPKSRCVLAGKATVVTAARVIDDKQTIRNLEIGVPIKLSRDSFGVTTAQGILEIMRLIPAGKPEMTAQAYLAGYGGRLF